MRSPVLVREPVAARAGLRHATIASIAKALPERVVGNDVIAAGAGVTEAWIEHRTGVLERRYAGEGETLTQLSAAAAAPAIEAAGLAPEELDLVLVACMQPDDLTPNVAPLVAHELGAVRAGAMDLGAACTGFLSALALATAYVEARRADHVLVLGADVMSRLIDKTDRGTAALFGDGAGAAVVAPADGSGGHIGRFVLRSDGSGARAITATHHERLIRMQGHDTFKAAVWRMSEAALEATELAGLSLDDIDLFVFHQANARILRAVGERLGVGTERVVDCVGRFGNTSSATLPIALADARERGQLEPGMNVLLSAFGAGFTWGAGVIEWAA